MAEQATGEAQAPFLTRCMHIREARPHVPTGRVVEQEHNSSSCIVNEVIAPQRGSADLVSSGTRCETRVISCSGLHNSVALHQFSGIYRETRCHPIRRISPETALKIRFAVTSSFQSTQIWGRRYSSKDTGVGNLTPSSNGRALFSSV